MAWYGTFVERIKGFRLALWEELPDLGLYMDQVITFLERQYRPLFGGEKRIITPAMINNYVKSGLVFRPVQKKYEREQIAQLSMLCALKQAIALDDMRLLIQVQEGESVEETYRAFCAEEERAMQRFHDVLQELEPLQCAIQGAAYQLLCEEMLHAKT